MTAEAPPKPPKNVSLLTLITVGKLTYGDACKIAPHASPSTKSQWKRAQEHRDRLELEAQGGLK